jgi:hypothetical protein
MKNLEITFVNLDVGFIVFCGDIVNPTTNWYSYHLCESNHTEDEFLF